MGAETDVLCGTLVWGGVAGTDPHANHAAGGAPALIPGRVVATAPAISSGDQVASGRHGTSTA